MKFSFTMLRMCAVQYCQSSKNQKKYTHNSRLSSFDTQYFTITIWWSLTGCVYDVESDFSWHVGGWLPSGENGVSELHILEQYKETIKKKCVQQEKGRWRKCQNLKGTAIWKLDKGELASFTPARKQRHLHVWPRRSLRQNWHNCTRSTNRNSDLGTSSIFARSKREERHFSQRDTFYREIKKKKKIMIDREQAQRFRRLFFLKIVLTFFEGNNKILGSIYWYFCMLILCCKKKIVSTYS